MRSYFDFLELAAPFLSIFKKIFFDCKSIALIFDTESFAVYTFVEYKM